LKNFHVKNIYKTLTKNVRQKVGFFVEFCVEVSRFGREFGKGLWAEESRVEKREIRYGFSYSWSLPQETLKS